MARIIAIGLLLLFATWAVAGTYTVTTGGSEDTYLQQELDTKENPRRAAKGQAGWSLPEFVQHLLNQNIKPIKEYWQQQEVTDACTEWATLSGAEKDTIRALLGGHSPCKGN